MMKKRGTVVSLLSVIALLLVSSVSAQAFITVNWRTTAPLLVYGGTTYPADKVPDGSLIQLIWTADMNMDAPVGSASTTGDDQILDSTGASASGLAGLNGIEYTYLDLSGVTEGQFNAGHVYVRAWDAVSPVGGTDYYKQGAFVTTLTIDPGDPSAYDNADLSGGGLTPMDTLLPVPEPSSLALAGLGMLVVLVRRRLRA